MLVTENKHVIYWVLFVAAVSGLLFGFDTGIVSGAILPINKEFHLTHFDTSFVISSALFGACVSAVVSGRIVDYCGRRHLLMFNAFLFFCGALGSALVPTIKLLVVSRTIVGFAIGISSYVVPLYISELAPFSRRGVMVGLNQLFIVIGVLLSYIVSYSFSFGEHWRLMFGMGSILAVMVFIGLLFVPESPRWLVVVGKEHVAREVLKMVRRTASSNSIELELFEIKESVNEQRQDWKMLFKAWILPAMIVGFGIAAFQQLVGINIFIYYGSFIFASVGFAETSGAVLASLGIGIILTVFTIIGLPLIDKWGRRPLLLLGSVGMTISLAAISSALWFLPRETVFFKEFLLLNAVGYIASFAISFGPIGWLMISEMFPLRIRGLAMSLATATIWGVNMLVMFTFLPLVHWLQFKGVFLLYAILCFFSLFFVYFLVPETKKVSLEHIEANLRLGKRSRDLGE